jgi:hypothetical protein
MDREQEREEAMRPVEEAGGGEAEGFEQAEAELIDAAEHGDAGGPADRDAFPAEAEPDPATHGDADEVLATEDAEETGEDEDEEEERGAESP